MFVYPEATKTVMESITIDGVADEDVTTTSILIRMKMVLEISMGF